MRLSKLIEIRVQDPKVQEQIRRFAELSDDIDKVTANLKALKAEYGSLEGEIQPVLDSLDDTKESALEVDDILVTIKRKGYERTSVGYKAAFDWLYERVNPAMKKIVDKALSVQTKVVKVSATIGVQRIKKESVGASALKKMMTREADKLDYLNDQLDVAIDSLQVD